MTSYELSRSGDFNRPHERVLRAVHKALGSLVPVLRGKGLVVVGSVVWRPFYDCGDSTSDIDLMMSDDRKAKQLAYLLAEHGVPKPTQLFPLNSGSEPSRSISLTRLGGYRIHSMQFGKTYRNVDVFAPAEGKTIREWIRHTFHHNGLKLGYDLDNEKIIDERS